MEARLLATAAKRVLTNPRRVGTVCAILWHAPTVILLATSWKHWYDASAS